MRIKYQHTPRGSTARDFPQNQRPISWGLIGLLVCLSVGIPLWAQGGDRNLKLAQTGNQFLSVGTDARTGALAGAGTALDLGANALFYNPAALANLETGLDIALNRNNWIADISHQSISVAINPFEGRFGIIGITFFDVDYGECLGTMVWPNDQGFIDTGPFYPTALAAGLGYARRLTDRFAAGGQVKYVAQYLGDVLHPADASIEIRRYSSDILAYDFGTLYRTPFRNLVFAMSVRNFSEEATYVRESFQLPLTFTIGASVDLFELLAWQNMEQQLRLSLDASHPRSHPEIMNLGAEYRLLDYLALRVGYQTNTDEYGISAGFGIELPRFAFDYAFTPAIHFVDIQRFTLRFYL
ncbi:MAG: PorV/PorQ family protein [Candidatus Marinimicrobia bacterium]|nr:PorV/PorQ family protein [Candidatus Neomarinimicrobiota bacterium]